MLRRLLWVIAVGTALGCGSTQPRRQPNATETPQTTDGMQRTVCNLVGPTMRAAVSEFEQQMAAPHSEADTGLGNSRNALHALVDSLPPTAPVRIAVNQLADGLDAGVHTLTSGQRVDLEPLLEAEHRVLDACAPYATAPAPPASSPSTSRPI